MQCSDGNPQLDFSLTKCTWMDRIPQNSNRRKRWSAKIGWVGSLWDLCSPHIDWGWTDSVVFTASAVYRQGCIRDRYRAMGVGDSEKFFALRREMLTPKYRLFDHGWTLIAVAFILAPGALTHWRGLRSPGLDCLSWRRNCRLCAVHSLRKYLIFPRRWTWEFSALGWFARIPLGGIFLVTVGLFVWMAGHLAFFEGEFKVGVPLVCALTRRVNPWLAFVFCATVLIVLLYIVQGSAAHHSWRSMVVLLCLSRFRASSRRKKVVEVKWGQSDSIMLSNKQIQRTFSRPWSVCYTFFLPVIIKVEG